MKNKHINTLFSILILGLTCCNSNTSDSIIDSSNSSSSVISVHEHTFSSNWNKNDSCHWHDATCEHTELTSNLAPHDYGDDNICDTCGYVKELNKYSFTFKSDFCNLDNQDSYVEGEELNLTLATKEGMETYLLPNKIDIYFGNNLGILGEDYSYELVNNVGKILLTITNNIFLKVMLNTDENLYRINKNQFDYAVNNSNFEYLQYDYSQIIYSSISVNLKETVVNYSKDAIYAAGFNLYAGNSFNSFFYEYNYFEKDGENYYRYFDNGDGWETSNIDALTFENFKKNQISLNSLAYIGENYKFTYEMIENKFNSRTLTYDFEVTTNKAKFDVSMSFFEGKVASISATEKDNANTILYLNVSYKETTVIVPEEIKSL